MTVAVVGGGIAGLCAAHELVRRGADVTVLEREPRTGGVILTERVEGGFLVEGGPDCVVAARPEVPELARELGIAAELIGQAARSSWLWTGSALVPLAEGEAARLMGLQSQQAEPAGGMQTFRGGMGALTEALDRRLGAAIRAGVAVTRVERVPGGYRLTLSDGRAEEFTGIVLALPAHAAAPLLAGLGVQAGVALERIAYHASLTVSLAYPRHRVRTPLGGTGFLVQPGGVATGLSACTFASSKFAGRAPEGHVLLRAFLVPGDGDAVRRAHCSLAPILGITGEPLWGRVFPWPRGLPQYPAGHAALVAAVRERLEREPLAIAGAGYDGPGVPDCVASGRRAAREIVGRMGGRG